MTPCHIFGVSREVNILPTKTFLNLPEEKKKSLEKAAYEEFSRVLFPEASINRIIKNAGISRGSFYMYFEDKQDLYSYLLEQSHIYNERKLKRLLQQSDGDMISTFIRIYDTVSEMLLKESKKAFFRNMFLNMDFGTERHLFCKQKNSDKKQYIIEKFADLIDIEPLRIENREELIGILDLMIHISIHSLVTALMSQEEQSVIREKYIGQLDIIKNGLYKK